MDANQGPKAQKETIEGAARNGDKPSRAPAFNWFDWVKSVGAVIALIIAISAIYAEWRIVELKVRDAELEAKEKLIAAKENLLAANTKSFEMDKVLHAAEQKLSTMTVRNRELAAEADDLKTEVESKQSELTRFEDEISKLQAELQRQQKLAPTGSQAQSALTAAVSSTDVVANELARQNQVVYVRFRGSIERETMKGVQAALKGAGFQVPVLERTATIETTEIVFTSNKDQDAARDIASIARTYFEKRCPPQHEIPVRQGPVSNATTKFEVRIFFSCS